MKHLFSTLAVLLVVSQTTSLCAQETKKKAKPDIVREIVVPPSGKKNEPPPPEPPNQYHVKNIAAAEPVPALKYRLYPSRGEMKPGNSVPFYYRTLISLKENSNNEFWKKFDAIRESLDDSPLSEYVSPENHAKVQEVVGILGEYSLRHNLKEAVYREQTNWDYQLNRLEGFEPISFILEEAQQARSIARVLDLRARLQAAEGDYEGALESCLLNFKTARDFAEPTTLINDLIGVAMSSISAAVLRDMICQTECPNLYWALATLPDPMISMREGIEYEAALPEIMFPFLKDPETATRTDAEWARLMRETWINVRAVDGNVDLEDPQQQALNGMMGAGMLIRSYPIAKRELLAAGWDEDKLEAMSVGQVTAIYQKRMTRSLYDESIKWSLLPFADVQEQHQQGNDFHRRLREGLLEPIPIASLLLPAVTQVKQAESRLRSQIKGLMVVEAIRMHAAANEGELPKRLADIKVVPVPECPMTGNPFEYQLTDSGATLMIPWTPENQKKLWWEIHFKN